MPGWLNSEPLLVAARRKHLSLSCLQPRDRNWTSPYA